MAETAVEAMEREPSGLDGWMKAIGSLEDQPAPPPAEKKEETNVPATEKPAGEAGPAASATPTAETPKPATETPKPAAEQPKPAETPKPATETPKPVEDEESAPPPRSAADWDKWKSKKKEQIDAIKKDIATREATIAELTAAKKALEEKLSAPVTEATNPELEKLKADNQKLTETIMALDVEKHPKFQEYFGNLTNTQIERAKKIVGPDQAEDIEKALRMPDTSPELAEIKQAAVEEVVSGLNTLQQARIGAVLNAMDEINAQRAAEIAKGEEARKARAAQGEERVKQLSAHRDKVFNSVLSSMQDPKSGMFLYQEKAGDATWNQGVKERVSLAKRLMTGDGVKPEDVVNASFTAVAFPALLAAYRNDVVERDKKIASLEAQVKAMDATQPKGGTTAPTTAPTEKKFEVKPGQNPHEVASAWAESLPGGWGA